jgi:hypothetical protein
LTTSCFISLRIFHSKAHVRMIAEQPRPIANPHQMPSGPQPAWNASNHAAGAPTTQ